MISPPKHYLCCVSKMIRILVLIFPTLLWITTAAAQDSLFSFQVTAKPGKKNLISWRNNYTNVSRISIQRSTDSLSRFTTIVTVPDATVIENGFMDGRPPNSSVFYRLFIVFTNGGYVFTPSKRPGPDTGGSASDQLIQDTRGFVKPPPPKEIPRSSKYVYTERFGNVMVSLPDAREKRYSISFYEENNRPLFEIEKVTSPTIVVDKANFVHSGWFWYELFESGTLIERQKIFIPRDF